MIVQPDMATVLSWDQYLAEEDKDPPPDWKEERPELIELRNRARRFLERHSWCSEIKREYVGMFWSGIITIFLFEFVRAPDEVDEWIWVIIGDIPSAYVNCEYAANPAQALNGYIGEMGEWVKAAEKGDPVDHVIPVNVPATPENAKRLRWRLEFLDREILSQYEDLR